MANRLSGAIKTATEDVTGTAAGRDTETAGGAMGTGSGGITAGAIAAGTGRKRGGPTGGTSGQAKRREERIEEGTTEAGGVAAATTTAAETSGTVEGTPVDGMTAGGTTEDAATTAGDSRARGTAGATEMSVIGELERAIDRANSLRSRTVMTSWTRTILSTQTMRRTKTPRQPACSRSGVRRGRL